MISKKNNTSRISIEHNQTPDKSFNSKRKIIGMGVILLSLAIFSAFVLVFYRSNDSNYVFIIDGKRYSKAEVEKLTEYPVGVEKKNQSSASEDLYELLYTLKAAEDLNINFSTQKVNPVKQQIIKDLGVDKTTQDKYSEWFTLLAKYKVVMQGASDVEVEGYMYDFYFGHHIEHGPNYRPDNLGDRRLIGQDKKYAKDRAEYYKNALTNKTITPEVALKEVQQDPKLNQGGGLESSKTRQFKSAEGSGWKEQLFNDEDRINIIERIEEANKPSDIVTGKVLASPSAKNKEDMSYYFVYLTTASNAEVKSGDLSKALKDVKASYKGY